MRDKDLYQQILGIERPWAVTHVDLNRAAQEVVVKVSRDQRVALKCPVCAKRASGYDQRVRRWRHLDTCQFKTILEAEVPRVQCKEHGVHQDSVPWAEEGSRFTALFEALVIDWLHEASVSGVASQVRLSWHEVSGIQERAVSRGLARRAQIKATRIGVDETSFQKRHEYVTVVVDQDESTVIHVADDRDKAALEGFYKELGTDGCAAIESVAMDMWPAYIGATREYVSDADERISFDRFHVAQHLGDAVDKVRRRENKELLALGDDQLKGTRYSWLTNPENMDPVVAWEFSELRDSSLKVARAWAIKEAARPLWKYVSRTWARKAWLRWYGWAIRSRLEPVKKVARMVKRHLEGILTAVVAGVTNAASESINGTIQQLKRRANGYRNRERFRMAIYFHLGGLDMYPRSLRSTHTKA